MGYTLLPWRWFLIINSIIVLLLVYVIGMIPGLIWMRIDKQLIPFYKWMEKTFLRLAVKLQNE